MNENLENRSSKLDDVPKAFEIIKNAMIEDSPSERGSYAHSWHCNIAMMCYDAMREKNICDSETAHAVGNDAASRFMKLCFGVETRL